MFPSSPSSWKKRGQNLGTVIYKILAIIDLQRAKVTSFSDEGKGSSMTVQSPLMGMTHVPMLHNLAPRNLDTMLCMHLEMKWLSSSQRKVHHNAAFGTHIIHRAIYSIPELCEKLKLRLQVCDRHLIIACS